MNTIKKQLRAFLVVATVLFTGFGCTKQSDVQPSQTEYRHEINYKPALTTNEYAALAANQDANLIRSVQTIDALVEQKKTPLAKLSPSLLDQFKATLVFKKGAVASMQYSLLKQNLSPDDFFSVMVSFGVDAKNGFWGLNPGKAGRRGIPPGEEADHEGYSCVSRATCTKTVGSICMGSY